MHSFSVQCQKSELDHFFAPPTQTAIKFVKFVTYRTVGSNLTSDSIPWKVASTPNEAVDLAHSLLFFDVCLLTVDNGNQGRNVAFGPVNLLSRSLVSGHVLLLNNEPCPQFLHCSTTVLLLSVC